MRKKLWLMKPGKYDDISDAKSERSTAALLGGSKETVGSKAKVLWKKLKEENSERKTNVQYVTSQEATAMTGHGENGRSSGVENGKGDKRAITAVLFF